MTQYVDLDPFKEPCEASSPGQWVTDDSLLDPARSPSRQYVADFAQGAGMRWLTGGKVMESPSGSAYFTVHRPQTMRSFDSGSLNILDVLFPHLQRVSRLHLSLAPKFSALHAARLGIDEFAQPACVLDEVGRVVFANAAMEAFLTTYPNILQVNNRRVSFVPMVAQSALQELLSQMKKRQTHAVLGDRHGLDPLSFGVNTQDGTLLTVRMVPLDRSSERNYALAHTGVLAVFVGVDPIRYPPGQLAATLGLTLAEGEIVSLLVAGFSAEACAAGRNVSLSTVRTQIASILNKTGQSSQVQLVALATTIPRTFS